MVLIAKWRIHRSQCFAYASSGPQSGAFKTPSKRTDEDRSVTRSLAITDLLARHRRCYHEYKHPIPVYPAYPMLVPRAMSTPIPPHTQSKLNTNAPRRLYKIPRKPLPDGRQGNKILASIQSAAQEKARQAAGQPFCALLIFLRSNGRQPHTHTTHHSLLVSNYLHGAWHGMGWVGGADGISRLSRRRHPEVTMS